MPYAINGSSFRSIDSHDDLLIGEAYSENIPDIWPSEPCENDKLRAQIALLEAQVTARRYREAILGIDSGWLQNINDQISKIRLKITN